MTDILNKDLLHALNQRARLFQKSMNHVLKDHGLFASQWSILFCLRKFGPMTQTDVSHYLHVEAPTVTRTLIKMEDSGWIARKQGTDKRARLIELTTKAEEEFLSIQHSVEELEEHILENFTMEEKQQFYNLLHKMQE